MNASGWFDFHGHIQFVDNGEGVHIPATSKYRIIHIIHVMIICTTNKICRDVAKKPLVLCSASAPFLPPFPLQRKGVRYQGKGGGVRLTGCYDFIQFIFTASNPAASLFDDGAAAAVAAVDPGELFKEDAQQPPPLSPPHLSVFLVFKLVSEILQSTV